MSNYTDREVPVPLPPVSDAEWARDGVCNHDGWQACQDAGTHVEPIRFHLAEDRPTTYAGYADGSTWNGFDNVKVTPAVRAQIVAELTALWAASPIGELSEYLSEIDTLPVDDGFVSLADCYCTTVCTAACEADHGEWAHA